MMAKMLENFNEQVDEALSLSKGISFSNFDKILVAGMGGSGISGYVLRDVVDMPVFVNQGFNIPRWVDSKTLAFVISYSGNTIETLSMHKQISRKTDKILCIATGGKLASARKVLLVPGGSLPKNSFHYLFFPMLNVIRNSGKMSFSKEDILKAIKMVDKKNALNIAKKIKGKTPVVYSSNGYNGVALRWKQNFNETSKQIAIAGSYPEFFHNEIEGDYSKFKVVILQDKTEKRLEYFKKIVKCEVVKLKGNSRLDKAVYGIHTGDYVAYNLALLNKIDPDSEHRIDKLKEILGK